jgi:hypothetical protein
MLRRLRDILEMIRFSHTLFALPFALLSAVMAWSLGARSDPPVAWRWQELLGIVLCMVTARHSARGVRRRGARPRLGGDRLRRQRGGSPRFVRVGGAAGDRSQRGMWPGRAGRGGFDGIPG